MPLSQKGEQIKSALTKEYGKEKGERVMYAGKNKGTFTGIDAARGDADYESVAKELGTKAHKAGKSSTPASDQALMDLIKKANPSGEVGGGGGSTVKLLQAWSKGWHGANLGKLDCDKLDRLADSAERLSARFDAVMSQSEYKKLVRERDEAKKALIEANNNPQTGNLGVFEKEYTRASGALAKAQVQMSKSKWDCVADAVDRLSARFDARVDADNEAHNKEWALKVAKWKSQWTPDEKKAVEKYNPDLAASREKQKAK